MIWLCTHCGEPYCDRCEKVSHNDLRPACEDCLNAEPDPDLERKARMEAGA